MLGFIRLFLAWIVVSAHVGGVGGFRAGYAVFAFYMLSGWLMTLIINERYGDGARGFWLYCLNRALRIFPLYWAGCAVAMMLLAWRGPDLTAFHSAIRWPTSVGEWLSNVFLIGLQPEAPGARLVPPAWALAVEIVYYAAIGAFLGRGKFIAAAWFAGAALYHAAAVRYGLDRYYSIAAASLPFSIGALIYHFGDAVARWFGDTWRAFLTSAGVYAAFIVAGPFIFPTAERWSLVYVNLALFAVVIVTGRHLKLDNGRRFDQLAGDSSYPVYLYHYLVAFAVASLFGFDAQSPGLLIASAVPLAIVSFGAAVLTNQTVDHIRHRVSRLAESHRRRGAFSRT